MVGTSILIISEFVGISAGDDTELIDYCADQYWYVSQLFVIRVLKKI